MADITWSAFPTIGALATGDTLVGLRAGANVKFNSLTIPWVVANGGTGLSTLTTYTLLAGGTTATGNLQQVGAGNAGQLLQSNGAAALPAWTTATFPATAGSAGTILRSNGTNWVNSTSTFADTYGASTLLYSNGANTVTGLATANNGVLITSNTGVPSLLANSGTPGYVLTANSGAPPSWKANGYLTGAVLLSPSGNQVITTGRLIINNGIVVLGDPTSGAGAGLTALSLYSPTGSLGNLGIYSRDNAGNFANILQNAATTAIRTWTLPDVTGTISVLGNIVTGTGSVVLATSPTLVTPNIGAATGTSLTTSGQLTATAGRLVSGAGAGGFTGALQLFPTTATRGNIFIYATSSSGNFGLSITNASYGQDTTLTIPNPGSATAKFVLTAVSGGQTISNATFVAPVLGSATATSIVITKVNGTEASNLVTASGNAGVITTSALTTAAAGNYAITWTNTAITSTSVITLTTVGGTNTTINYQMKVIPGAGSATLTIYNNSVATALNGTILIAYSVF